MVARTTIRILPRRMLHVLTGVTLLVLGAAGCAPLSVLDAMVPTSGYTAETGLAYGEGDRRKLDVYRPVGVSASRDLVVVWLYGGAWKQGAREDYRFVGQTLASRGYATVVPDYRVYPEAKFPAFNQDAAAAVAWVWKNLRAPDGGPPRIVLAGHSAGAHMAALVALDRRYLAAEGVPEEAIAGVVPIAGPLAFDVGTYRSTRAIFRHAAFEDYAPINFVRADSPPMLVIHGTSDGTVAPWNSQRFTDKMRSLGAPVRYIPVKDVGHYFIVAALAEPFAGEDDPVVTSVMDFLGELAQ